MQCGPRGNDCVAVEPQIFVARLPISTESLIFDQTEICHTQNAEELTNETNGRLLPDCPEAEVRRMIEMMYGSGAG